MARTETQRLQLFCDRVDLLLNRRAVAHQTITVNVRSGTDADGRLRTDANLGDPEDLRSLLLDLRRFFAPSEPVHFPSIANVIERCVTDRQLVADGRVTRAAWKDVLDGWMHLVINGKTYDAEAQLDLLLNGEALP